MDNLDIQPSNIKLNGQFVTHYSDLLNLKDDHNQTRVLCWKLV